MDKIEWERFRFEHGWRMLQLYAQQRAGHFNTSVFFFAAVYLLVGLSVQYSMMALTIWSCILGGLGAVVFWGMDQRCRALVRAAENALKEYEVNHMGVPGIFYADVFAKTDGPSHPATRYGEAPTVFYAGNLLALAVLAIGGYLGFFELIGV